MLKNKNLNILRPKKSIQQMKKAFLLELIIVFVKEYVRPAICL